MAHSFETQNFILRNHNHEVRSQHVCPLCGSRNAKPVFEALADASAANDAHWDIIRCQHCQLLILHPRPSAHNLLALYPKEYSPFRLPYNLTPTILQRWVHRRHYALYYNIVCLVGVVHGKRVLDAGCATGNFLHYFSQQSGIPVVGIDLHPQALRVAYEQNIPVLCGELGQVALASGTFSLITLWDVLEHVPHVRSTLAEVHRLLEPEGIVIASTPNETSFQAVFWGKYWCAWDIPRHLQIFSLETLQKLLEQCGFSLFKRHSFPMERYVFVESFKRMMQSYVGNPLPQLLNLLIHLIAWSLTPLFFLLDRSRFASSLVIEAKRVERSGPVC
jgi:2-polyprenyl-3-methyl-5-hydroxy-6-metoxy-1,4-benzoquinol methylase